MSAHDRSRLTNPDDKTDHNYPTADDATRDFSSFEDSSGSNFSVRSGSKGKTSGPGTASMGEVPEQIGSYVIREMIGSGGMGQVFLAEHKRMQRVVAIKMLPVERMADEVAVERFYEEVRAASRLMHPNIVTAFDADEVNGMHYLAMEYVDGKTLTEIVSEKGPFSVGETAAVIRQSALGLLHAHRAGIVHRDVKPSNLMRAADGTVKVLDLGLAQISSASLVTEKKDVIEGDGNKAKTRGRLTGTLPFMSPEQLEDSNTTDSRTDIYSLGATMYFLLTGQPPYTGEFLDLVYGHRHGEIPDLMQVRDDVDMKFANIFNRMMAKDRSERYASLDEVIDELGEYASNTDTPAWIAEYTPQPIVSDTSMGSASGSTYTGTARVMAIDFGMFYSAAAEGSPSGEANLLAAGGETGPLFRMAVSSDNNRLIYGSDAVERRREHPKSVVHCLPMYIGKPIVEREIAGRQCPPEVLMAMLFRRIVHNSWTGAAKPHATAITIPASFDQLHRQSVLQAARMAGLRSVRLVDRCVAAVHSLLIDRESESLDASIAKLDKTRTQNVLFVGVTGQGTEVSVMRRDASRLQQVSTVGHWHTGTLPWLSRLVDLTAKTFVQEHKFDPRSRSRTASRLQIACERAMNSLLLLPSATIKIDVDGKDLLVKISRRRWFQSCESLAVGVRDAIKLACKQGSVSLGEIDTCVTMGPLLRIKTIRDAVLRGHHEKMVIHPMDRAEAARGAAASLASELPGRGEIARPPRLITSQAIGIVVNDAKGRRRILPVIPKGTALPARTNRRLTVGNDRDSMNLSLVESSGVAGEDWQSLGRYDFEVGDSKVRTRMIGFEINVNGMLTVRAQTPGTSGSKKLPPLPTPTLSEEELDRWTQWLDRLT